MLINELIPNICRIHLGPVLEYGSIPETAYNVVKQQNYCGEVHVALTFHPEVNLFHYKFESFFFRPIVFNNRSSQNLSIQMEKKLLS